MFRVLRVLAQVNVTPSADGMPGADLIQQLLNWAQMLALWGSLAALLAGAAMYGLAREGGAKVLAITNVMGSQATRDSDAVLFTRAGLEIGVAATKTFVAQVAAMYLLALRIAELRDTLPPEDLRRLVAELKRIPHHIAEMLENGLSAAIDRTATPRRTSAPARSASASSHASSRSLESPHARNGSSPSARIHPATSRMRPIGAGASRASVPSASSTSRWRTASTLTNSPQTLRRGNAARSTTATFSPALARK